MSEHHDYGDVVNVLALCAGYSGIELGIELVMPEARVVCYVERDAYTADRGKTVPFVSFVSPHSDMLSATGKRSGAKWHGKSTPIK